MPKRRPLDPFRSTGVPFRPTGDHPIPGWSRDRRSGQKISFFWSIPHKIHPNMRGPILAMVTVAMVACEATAFLLGPGASLQRHTPALKAASSKARVGVFGARKGPGFITKMVDENTSGTATLVKPGEAKLALSYFLKDEGATITATTGGVSLLNPFLGWDRGGSME